MTNSIFVVNPAERPEDIYISRYDFDPSTSRTIVNMSSATCVTYGNSLGSEEREREVTLTNRDTGITMNARINVESKNLGRPANERLTLRGRSVFSTKAEARAAAKKLVKALQIRDTNLQNAENQFKKAKMEALGIVYYC